MSFLEFYGGYLEIYACPRCGSRRIRQGALHIGALTGSKEVCLHCGYQGMPIIFESEEQYHKFLNELSTENNELTKTSLSEKDKMVLEYAKETDFKREEKDSEKKPYGLIVIVGITLIYSYIFPSILLLFSYLFYFPDSLQSLINVYWIILLSYSIIAIIAIPYGFYRRKRWTYTLSGFLFILSLPTGMIFLYYLTRTHVKAYFGIK
jgi:hypothetical protein